MCKARELHNEYVQAEFSELERAGKPDSPCENPAAARDRSIELGRQGACTAYDMHSQGRHTSRHNAKPEEAAREGCSRVEQEAKARDGLKPGKVFVLDIVLSHSSCMSWQCIPARPNSSAGTLQPGRFGKASQRAPSGLYNLIWLCIFRSTIYAR